MSRKALLNVTSRKKRDTMQSWSNTTPSGDQETYFNVPAVITGGSSTVASFVWCATARSNDLINGGGPGNVFDAATRTATTCFMRGLSEKIEIQVVDGLPWQWRRICITAKGLQLAVQESSTFQLRSLTSSGYQRTVNQIRGGTQGAFEGVLFKGIFGQDWFDQMLAPIDTNRVTVKYDKTITIASGNDEGCIRKFNRWHGMNHNLVYDDDELGGGTAGDDFSAQGKAGMGDYYVIDYFRPRNGATIDNQLLFCPNATLYWHEK